MEVETRVFEGPIRCGSWIRFLHKDRNQHRLLVVRGRWASSTCSPLIEILAFDSKTSDVDESALVKCAVDGEPLSFAVHPNGEEFVCATTKGCRLFGLYCQDMEFKMVVKDLKHLQDVSPQTCMAFSTDGSRFATGGEDGHLRIFEWPTQKLLLDEPKAHKSIRDMDISLDSEFLATTSIDGSARIWKIDEGVPLTPLMKKADERIECCRFSRHGMKPFLFCTMHKGNKAVVGVWQIINWKKLGERDYLKKHSSSLSVSLDGKYLALGSIDGDICIIDVHTMDICNWNTKLHLGTSISHIEFCPTERVVLTTSRQWGAIVTKLGIKDWKDWQIYAILIGMFLASLALYMVFYKHSDPFWKLPNPAKRPVRDFISNNVGDNHNTF